MRACTYGVNSDRKRAFVRLRRSGMYVKGSRAGKTTWFEAAKIFRAEDRETKAENPGSAYHKDQS